MKVIEALVSEMDARLDAIDLTSGPLLERIEAASKHTNFVADTVQLADLMSVSVPDGIRDRLANMLIALDDLDQQAITFEGDVPGRFQNWMADISSINPPKIPREAFDHFLQKNTFPYDGMEISLADMKGLLQVAPDAVTPAMIAAFDQKALDFAGGYAQCLNETYAKNVPAAEQVLASTLAIDPNEIPELLSVPDLVTADETRVFETPEELRDTVRAEICKGNSLGHMITPMFEAGHILIGGGPDYSFTIAPDPDLPPFAYVPFTGTAIDAVLLYHQIGHGIHARLALTSDCVMSRLPARIDEIIPLLFEQRCYATITQSLHAKEARNNDTARDLAHFSQWHKIVRAAGQGSLDAGAILALQKGLNIPLFKVVLAETPFAPLALSSFAYGDLKSQMVEGWDERRMIDFGQQGAAGTVEMLTKGS